MEAKFTAWYEDGAEPYTFVIDAKLTGDFWERVDWTKPTQTIRHAIEQSKATRSYMSKLYVHYENQSKNHTYFVLGLSQGIFHDIGFQKPKGSNAKLHIQTGILVTQSTFYEIGFTKNYTANKSLKIPVIHGISQGIFHNILNTER